MEEAEISKFPMTVGKKEVINVRILREISVLCF